MLNFSTNIGNVLLAFYYFKQAIMEKVTESEAEKMNKNDASCKK